MILVGAHVLPLEKIAGLEVREETVEQSMMVPPDPPRKEVIPTHRPRCRPGLAWVLALTLAGVTASAALAAEYPPVQFPSPGGWGRHIQRMPTFGLPVWREILDGVAEDGANTVILWC